MFIIPFEFDASKAVYWLINDAIWWKEIKIVEFECVSNRYIWKGQWKKTWEIIEFNEVIECSIEFIRIGVCLYIDIEAQRGCDYLNLKTKHA